MVVNLAEKNLKAFFFFFCSSSSVLVQVYDLVPLYNLSVIIPDFSVSDTEFETEQL